MTDLERHARRLSRVDGVTPETPQDVGSYMVLDFSFDWPGAVPVEKSPNRASAVERSAFICTPDGTVREYQFRLPPLPKAENPDEGDTIRRLEVLANRHSRDVLSVMLADDCSESWTPHVQPANGASVYESPERLVDDVIAIWNSYQDRVLSDPFGRV